MSEQSLISALSNICLKEKFADVTFVCGDGARVQAHKVILALRSGYFAAMLFREEEELGDQVVVLTCRGTVLRIIIQHLYCQAVSLSQEDIPTLMELLDHAREMGVYDLEQIVEEALCDNFLLVDNLGQEAIGNVINLLNNAVKRKCEALTVDAFNFISENIEIFVASDSFHLLSPESILALFTASKVRPCPEIDQFNFNTHFHNSVIKWLFKENDLKNNIKQSILDHLDMELIFAENLFDLMQMKIIDSVEHILEENIVEIEGLRNELENLKHQLQASRGVEKNTDQLVKILKDFGGEIITKVSRLNTILFPQSFNTDSATAALCEFKSCTLVSNVWCNLINTGLCISGSLGHVIANIYHVLNYLSRERNNNSQIIDHNKVFSS